MSTESHRVAARRWQAKSRERWRSAGFVLAHLWVHVADKKELVRFSKQLNAKRGKTRTRTAKPNVTTDSDK